MYKPVKEARCGYWIIGGLCKTKLTECLEKSSSTDDMIFIYWRNEQK